MLARLTAFLTPYKLLMPLCFGVFIAADDQTVVVTLLPDMMADLRVGVSELDRASWSITGYLIGYTAAMPLMGRFSDRLGYRNAFIIAMAVFSLGCVLVAISPIIPELLYGGEPEFGWLVGTRVFQAIGGGAAIPVAIASVNELVDSKHRAIAFGLIGASAEAGGVIGPLWGGGITTWISWEWAFWLNLPLTVLAVIWITRNPPARKNPVKIDLFGSAVFAALLALLTIGLVRIGEPDSIMSVALVLAFAFIAVLIFTIRRSESPLFPRELFGRMSFNLANVTHFLIGAVLIIGMVTVPLMAASVFGKSPLEGGLQLLRMTIAIGVGALIGGIVTQRIGARTPAIVGLLIAIAGFALLSRWTVDMAEPMITIHLAITGLGLGILVSPIAETGMTDAAVDHLGAASSLLTVSRMVGMTAGLAAMTALGTVQFQELVADVPAFSTDPAIQQEIVDSATRAGMDVFTRFYEYAVVISTIALVPAWLMTRRKP